MPIKDLSDVRRMPRLGKIRLGIKVEPEGKNPYPRATDYFVVPDEIKKIVGEESKKLNIMFPTETPEEFAQQWLRCYSFTQGLICKGDGTTAIRKIDVDNGDIASHTTEEWARKDWNCDPDTCIQYSEKQCRRVMNLLFLIPEVPGLGVWQLDTTSFYSIVNINSCVDLIKRLCGRISFIPLTLSLEPQIVEPPGIKKKTVNILQVRSEVKLAQIQKLGRVPPERVLLPALDEDEIPEDLIPEEILKEAEPAAVKEKTQAQPREEKALGDITVDDVPDMDAVVRLCFHFWKIKPVEICGELGYETMMDLHSSGISPWDTWLTIKQLKQPPKPEPESTESGEEVLWPEDMPPRSEDEAQLAPAPEPPPEPEPETKEFVDTAWLEKQLKVLRAKKLKAWTEVNLLSYLKTTYKVKGNTVLEAVGKLDKGAANHFIKRVQEALPMI